jgi:hypothetical protein
MMSELATRRNPTHTNNYRAGRSWTKPVDVIVIHVTEGSAASVRAWFADPAAVVSAHYMVTTAGGVEAFVDENDTAYHAGQLVRPSSQLVIDRHAAGGYTPNSFGIGIEHEGDGAHEMTPAQRAASIALVADIANRHGIPIDRTHIIGHHEIKASKTCPGAIDVTRLVADVQRHVGGGAPIVEPPAPVHIDNAPDIVPVYSQMLGWIIPVTITDDTHWTFASVADVRDALIKGRVFTSWQAGAPLSSFPRAKA